MIGRYDSDGTGIGHWYPGFKRIGPGETAEWADGDSGGKNKKPKP
jgi:hypothetical protein